MLKNVFVVITALGALARSSAAASDEIAVIVNKDSDVRELSPEQLEAIFTMSQRQWNGGANIAAFNYAPGNEIRIEFDRVVLHLSPKEVGRFWTDQRIRSGIHAPRQVNDPALVLRLTTKLTGAIGYVPAGIVSSSVKIVARIRDGKVLAPSHVQKTLGGEPGRIRPSSFRHAPTSERGLIQFTAYPGTATSLGAVLRERARRGRAWRTILGGGLAALEPTELEAACWKVELDVTSPQRSGVVLVGHGHQHGERRPCRREPRHPTAASASRSRCPAAMHATR
jgi:hypothetical protein